MKTNGVLYQGTNWRGLTFYNNYADLYKRPTAIDGLEHAAHISYGFEHKKKSLDIYLASGAISGVNITKRIKHFEHSLMPNFRNSVNYQIKKEFEGTQLAWELMALARDDIAKFCENPAKVQGESTVFYPAEIVPVTKISYIHPKKLLQDGKQDFVPACLLEANLDLSLGCSAGFIAGLVTGITPYFDGTHFVNFFQDIVAECEYCYAIYQHKTFPKTIVEIDRDQLKWELTHWNVKMAGWTKADGELFQTFQKKVDVLRMGKRTESGSIYTRKGLIDTLETCLETGTQVVIPTKFLEYDAYLAELFRKTKSVVLYSIGWDEVERGPVMQGFSNDFRLEQAVKYREAGVKTALYLLIDATKPAGSREDKIMDFAKEHKIPIQLLPFRVFSKDLANKVIESSWNVLKGSVDQIGMFGETTGGYSVTGNGLLTAEVIHPYWRALLNADNESNTTSKIITRPNNGVHRMCHHNSSDTYCGSCFLSPGIIEQTQHVEINYTKKGDKNKRYDAKNKRDKNQTNMRF